MKIVNVIKKVLINNAEVAHLVEHDLAKVGVAGSSPVFRSLQCFPPIAGFFFLHPARVVELVDTQDLKSCLQQCKCGSDSRPGHTKAVHFLDGLFYLFLIFLGLV